jgi:hypothetical protein
VDEKCNPLIDFVPSILMTGSHRFMSGGKPDAPGLLSAIRVGSSLPLRAFPISQAEPSAMPDFSLPAESLCYPITLRFMDNGVALFADGREKEIMSKSFPSFHSGSATGDFDLLQKSNILSHPLAGLDVTGESGL